MKPERVWNKYKTALTKKLSTDSTVPKMDDFSTMQTFQNADPTSNKVYLDWIVNSYVNDGIKRYEDLMSRVLPALKDYDYLKKSKKLTRVPGKGKAFLDETNILNFCGLAGCQKGKFRQPGLEDLIEKHAEELAFRRTQLQETEEIKQERKTIFESQNVKIIQPLTEAAACHYGRGTRWCTAATVGENLFESYNKEGPLYILIPTKANYPGEKYQLQFETDQYMDEKDELVSLEVYIITRFPELKNWEDYIFIQAVNDNNIAKLKELVTKGYNRNLNKLISLAIKENNIEILELLATKGIFPNQFSVNRVASDGKLDILKWLSTKDIFPDRYIMDLHTNFDKLDALKWLATNGIFVPDQQSANTAAIYCKLDILKWLAGKGILPDQKTLNITINDGNRNLVQWLVNNNILPDQESINLIAYYGWLDILKFLAPKGIFPNQVGAHWAASQKRLDVSEWLKNLDPPILPN